MKTIDEIREFFRGDKFATENNMVIDEVNDGYAKCSLFIGERHKNAVGAVMGGVSFTLADFAYAVASNHEEPKWVSQNSAITFLGVAKGEKLIAEAVRVKQGRSTNFYQITVKDDLDNLVASVSVNGFKKG